MNTDNQPERQFKIQADYRHPQVEHASSVPWGIVASHEAQAWQNHGQTLERLNQRGGLHIVELWHVVNDQDWRGPLENGARISVPDAAQWLTKLLENASVFPCDSSDATGAQPLGEEEA